MVITGAVQGIGFRPFVYRHAVVLDLKGWITNIPEGVLLEVEGEEISLQVFREKLFTEKPPLAWIASCEVSVLDPAGYTYFEIRGSTGEGKKSAVILPDIAVCPDCLRELFDPTNRRYRYPFINCTNCGPRMSIIESLPYDRIATSMNCFQMCPKCAREYEDPTNRRFHAQPNACSHCGPKLQYAEPDGTIIAEHDAAIHEAVRAIRAGYIVAVKGIGGFHLMADPFSDAVVKRMRMRKHREEKPMALMIPSVGFAKKYCRVSASEEAALLAPHAPIVLMEKAPGHDMVKPFSQFIAPGNPLLGVLLPYSPLHHLLMHDLQQPVIATSGNITEEPICIDEQEAFHRLNGIADFFLIHDRPIIRHADDSIVRIIAGREVVLRRGRGLAPLPVRLEMDAERSVLAVGGHLKNSIAINVGSAIFVSQHIGDLETEQSYTTFRSTIDDFKRMYEITPSLVVADKHPDYLSSKYAASLGIPLLRIQHHAAHVYSCMAENHLRDNVFGVSWDGTGYGDDGLIWGGEFFIQANGAMRHSGTFRSFPLPGGPAAVKEPRRSALGMLFELSHGNPDMFGELPLFEQFSTTEYAALLQAMRHNVNSPRTTSVGRIFDAVASIIGVRHRTGYEGQAAMELEALTEHHDSSTSYHFTIGPHTKTAEVDEIDWEQMIFQIYTDVKENVPGYTIALKFHNTLAKIIVEMTLRSKQTAVVLSGGCFQNARLTEITIERLRRHGVTPYWHQRIPPNDGGLALGQLYGAILLGQHKESKIPNLEGICV